MEGTHFSNSQLKKGMNPFPDIGWFYFIYSGRLYERINSETAENFATEQTEEDLRILNELGMGKGMHRSYNRDNSNDFESK